MTQTSPMRVVGDITRHHAAVRPETVAMVYEGRTTTYAAFDRHTSQVANGLIAAGVQPQRRIAYLDKNSDRFFETYLGAAKANVVLVGVNWRLAPPEIAYIINDAGAEVLFIGHEFVGMLTQFADQIPKVRQIVVLGGDGGDYPDFDAWRDSQDASDPRVPVAESDIAIQLYTSGTTGHPKGAQITNANVMAGVGYIAGGDIGRWGENEVNLVCLPIFHIGGAGWGLNGIFHGGASVILREVDPGAILRVFSSHRVTKAGFVPAVMLMLLNHPDCATTDFGPLDLIAYGASPIPLGLLRQAVATFKCDFIQLYGLSETTGPALTLQPQDHDPDGGPKMRSAGKPLPGVSLRIVGGEGQDLPPGEVGEIVLRGPVVMAGYWNLPDATAKAIIDGWFYTGDAGYTDTDGYLYVHDRVKDMIVTGGENVYPAEVESALFGHPAIADVAVIGVPDERWGEAVKAVVVLKPGAAATADDLIAHARQGVAGFKCPKTVDFVDVLPRNPSGKLLKRELRAPYWEGRERQVN